jgi:hypothetical protein
MFRERGRGSAECVMHGLTIDRVDVGDGIVMDEVNMFAYFACVIVSKAAVTTI